MSDDFSDRLKATFPKMYGDVYCGIWIDKGWEHIILNLSKAIQYHIDYKNEKFAKGHGEEVAQVTVAQIKEKFGGLRFYYDGGDEYIEGLVAMAENWALSTCEVCGDRGRYRGGEYIRTLCDKHEEERKK